MLLQDAFEGQVSSAFSFARLNVRRAGRKAKRGVKAATTAKPLCSGSTVKLQRRFGAPQEEEMKYFLRRKWNLRAGHPAAAQRAGLKPPPAPAGLGLPPVPSARAPAGSSSGPKPAPAPSAAPRLHCPVPASAKRSETQ